jgi:FAD:protein FMN transferase
VSEVNLLIPDAFGSGNASAQPEAFLPGHLSGTTMGTSWSAIWYAPPGVRALSIQAALEGGFAEIIASMSTWEQGSEISRYNQLGAGERLAVNPRFSHVLRMALDVAARSAGAFDPCLGRVISRRGFGGAGCAVDAGINTFGPSAWGRIAPDKDVLFQPGCVVLDLSAIAKGYAVDAMADVMVRHGVTQFLVEIGGEYAGRGVKPDGMPWWVDIENPYPEGDPWRLALLGEALATSGDYRQARLFGGQLISHIVPHPARHCEGGDLASVSVVHPSCALADAWATALFAAGDAEGIAMAEKEGLAALFQYRDAPPRLSRRLNAWLA